LYGNTGSITDPMGRITDYTYDATNRVLTITDPLGRVTNYSYDPYCNTSTITTPEGRTTLTQKDVLCRLTKVTYDDSFFHQFYYDNLGRVTSITSPSPYYGEFLYSDELYGFDPVNNTTYGYDENSQLISLTHPGANLITYAYDEIGRTISMTDIGGITTGYDYDDVGNLIQVSRTDTVWDYTYDIDRKLTQCSMSCGVISDYAYDVDNQLIQIKHSKDDDILYQIDYTYDKAGSRISRNISSTSGVKSEEYFYDPLYCLVRVEENYDLRTEYEYDPAGNRLKKITESDTVKYDYDATDEMIKAGGERCYYDRDGNMTKRKNPGEDEWNYDWDAAGRLMRASLTGGDAWRYYYDAYNLRTCKKNGSSITDYYWVPESIYGLPYVVNEKDGGGSLTASYILSPYGTLGIEAGGETRFYLMDALGSVLALADQNGSITDTYEYDEFGVPTAQSGTFYNPVRYANYYYDPESELYYLRARYYDAGIGRFISLDPISKMMSYLIDRYLYCKNNPIKLRDPSGLGVGPEACSTYDNDARACKCDEHDDTRANFLSGIAVACRDFGDNFLANCVRECLLKEYRIIKAGKGCPTWVDLSLFLVTAHIVCWSECTFGGQQ
ncbi:MAG: hypothetical protein PHU23_12945, partial [Dehalococcoidales bacterium]|nr:hypothetical protein [Dehalococcoidales bacterium]